MRSATRNITAFWNSNINHFFKITQHLNDVPAQGKRIAFVRPSLGRRRAFWTSSPGKRRSFENKSGHFKTCEKSASQTISVGKNAELLTPHFLQKGENTSSKVKCGSKNFRCQNLAVMVLFRREKCRQVWKNSFGPKKPVFGRKPAVLWKLIHWSVNGENYSGSVA